jgi:hypothetical protein
MDNTPRFATWVLRHFTTEEFVAGDLLEAYRRGDRSVLWYCRQVAIALWVEAVREVTTHPVALLSTVAFGWVVFCLHNI